MVTTRSTSLKVVVRRTEMLSSMTLKTSRMYVREEIAHHQEIKVKGCT